MTDPVIMELQRRFFRLIFLIRDRMQAAVQDAESGLTVLQLMVLRSVVEHGELTQKALAEELGKDKAQITRLVQDLLDKGLLTKSPDPEDRRFHILKPSKRVQDIVQEFSRLEYQLADLMVAGFKPGDIDVLNGMLARMQTNLKPRAE